jgi:uncharacterized membrane protein YkvA (DUF1232 family)
MKNGRGEGSPRTKIGDILVNVLDSKVFALAMAAGQKLSNSKSRVFRLLGQTFAKLKAESNENRFQEDFLLKLGTLSRMLKAYYNGSYRKVPSGAIMRIVGGLVYFVWVLDVIPDFIPILGFADDVAVIIWIYNGLNVELQEFEAWESAVAYNIDQDGMAYNGTEEEVIITKTTKS